MANMIVDYRTISIIGPISAANKIRAAIAIFGKDVTAGELHYAVRTGTVMTYVKVNTTNPESTVDSITRHLTIDTVVSPSVTFVD